MLSCLCLFKNEKGEVIDSTELKKELFSDLEDNELSDKITAMMKELFSNGVDSSEEAEKIGILDEYNVILELFINEMED